MSASDSVPSTSAAENLERLGMSASDSVPSTSAAEILERLGMSASDSVPSTSAAENLERLGMSASDSVPSTSAAENLERLGMSASDSVPSTSAAENLERLGMSASDSVPSTSAAENLERLGMSASDSVPSTSAAENLERLGMSASDSVPSTSAAENLERLGMSASDSVPSTSAAENLERIALSASDSVPSTSAAENVGRLSMSASDSVPSTSAAENVGRLSMSASDSVPSTSAAENVGSTDIQVFRPTMDEFRDFKGFIELIERKGAHKAGIAKIIPPAEWTETLCTRLRPHDIEAPLKQQWEEIANGIFIQSCKPVDSMTSKEFKKMAKSREINWIGESPKAIEQKFWAGLKNSEQIYGADVPGTNFSNKVDVWNLTNLPCILKNKEAFTASDTIDFKGITSPYLYFGSSLTAFAIHSEDLDLYSINFHHFGAPKLWSSIPPSENKKFEEFVGRAYKDVKGDCPAFIRHKQIMVSPEVLTANGIRVNTIVQYPGEFIITFPSAYHFGFNFGYNCNEATNFAMPRWLDYAKFTDWCCCKPRVLIPIDKLVKIYQKDLYEDFLEGRDPTPHPEFPDDKTPYKILTSQFVKNYYDSFSEQPPKKKRKTISEQPPKKKRKSKK